MSDDLVKLLKSGADDPAFAKKLCAKAAARIEDLEAALRPFARVADLVSPYFKDEWGIWSHQSNIPGQAFVLTVGDVRCARAVRDGTLRERETVKQLEIDEGT